MDPSRPNPGAGAEVRCRADGALLGSWVASRLPHAWGARLTESRTSDLDRFYAELAACRRCAQAGHTIGSRPIFVGHRGAAFMTVGQAPGRHEAQVTGLPFSGPAGRRLFRWLAEAGFSEEQFRATQAMTAITRCYPGPHPAGRGDRVPTRQEQILCSDWLDQELALIKPPVLVLIGRLAIDRFLPGDATLAGVVGCSFTREGRVLVPLPHPSGASQWFNATENKHRLAQAIRVLAGLRRDYEFNPGVDAEGQCR
jgi:uracil-DNA glycosylase